MANTMASKPIDRGSIPRGRARVVGDDGIGTFYSGYSAVWSAHSVWVRGAGGSNPSIPTLVRHMTCQNHCDPQQCKRNDGACPHGLVVSGCYSDKVEVLVQFQVWVLRSGWIGLSWLKQVQLLSWRSVRTP